MKILYRENFSTKCIHESGAELETELPKDLGGRGGAFSPTDLFSVGVGSCMLTLMAIHAKKISFDLTGTKVEVEKIMVSDPMRRIGKIIIRFRIPHKASDQIREKLEKAALDCPVRLGLHPNIKQDIEFLWGL